MEANYAQLMTRAQAVLDKAANRLGHRIFRTTHFLEAAAVVHELAQALTVVCTQNRNLRQDLAQVQRDYEANLESLLSVDTEVRKAEDQNAGLRTLVEMLAEHKNIELNVYVAPKEDEEDE